MCTFLLFFCVSVQFHLQYPGYSHSYILLVFGYIHIYFSWHVHTNLGQPPVPARYSKAHWSWVHLQWHLPSAVHDCGEICLNLQGTVLNGSHWSTFAWHCDWQSQSAYHGPGDGQTLIYRWDGLEWFWLIDRLSLSHSGITKTISAQQESNIMVVCVCWCFCMSVYAWMCLWVQVVSLRQITHHTLSVVTVKESGCQTGPAHIIKVGQY